MKFHTQLNQVTLHNLIKLGKITIAGNNRLKIYGSLNCTSGKEMKKENRVFFKHEAEARTAGFRPCGHCMRRKHKVGSKQGQ